MADLIKVLKDGAQLWVHPTTVAAHEAAGWTVSGDQTEDAPGVAAAKPSDAPVEIPADWAGLHWMKKVALAKKIAGRKDVTKDEAGGVIQAELDRRTAEAAALTE